MNLARNITKERLKEGKVAFGMQVRLVTSVAIARLAASAGYHYLFIDMEHNPFDVSTVSEMCIASLDAGITPTVRIPGNDYHMAARLMDNGCQGITVPHVMNAADAREAVRMCKFPPFGNRSFGGSPPQLGWEPLTAKECIPLLNENLQLVITIESAEALSNVEEIAAIEGVDAIAVGSTDLALDMGIPGIIDHPLIHEAHQRVLAAGRKNNIPIRIGGSFDPAFLKRVAEMGARMLSLSSDLRFLNEVMRGRLSEVQSMIDPKLLG